MALLCSVEMVILGGTSAFSIGAMHSNLASRSGFPGTETEAKLGLPCKHVITMSQRTGEVQLLSRGACFCLFRVIHLFVQLRSVFRGCGLFPTSELPHELGCSRLLLEISVLLPSPARIVCGILNNTRYHWYNVCTVGSLDIYVAEQASTTNSWRFLF